MNTSSEQDVLPVVQAFLSHLIDVKKGSLVTKKCYRRDLTQLIEYLRGHGFAGQDMEQVFRLISLDQLKDFVTHLKGLKVYEPCTISRKVAAIKSFFRWQHTSGRAETNPAKHLKVPQPKKAPVTVDLEKVRKLYLSLPSDTLLGLRDRAVIRLIFGCGLKVSEITLLDCEDVSADYLSIQVSRQERGCRVRRISLAPEAAAFLRSYIEKRRGNSVIPLTGPLFVNKHGDRLSSRSVRRNVFDRHTKSVGLSDVTPRTVRNSFATFMLSNGTNPSEVQTVLGHRSMKTTMKHKHRAVSLSVG